VATTNTSASAAKVIKPPVPVIKQPVIQPPAPVVVQQQPSVVVQAPASASAPSAPSTHSSR
jgi:hypothetical protein